MKNCIITLSFVLIAIMTSCANKNVAPPEEENETEVITDVTLTFVNTTDPADKVIARAVDPDGPGVKGLEVESNISLDTEKSYTLSITIYNRVSDADVTAEIIKEKDDHQFFFKFTDGAFSDPIGNGNFDNGTDPINYLDMDNNNLPVGLETSWTTGTKAINGTFHLTLVHMPALKTASASITTGDLDIDKLTFNLEIK